jgi:predicted  nucleic acid-binding Zn-ribbon protein
MKEPNLPSYTCPSIDAVQEQIQLAEKTLDDSLTHKDDAECLEGAIREALWLLRGESQKLEELRAANGQLREWGEWWKEQAESFENKLNELEQA